MKLISLLLVGALIVLADAQAPSISEVNTRISVLLRVGLSLPNRVVSAEVGIVINNLRLLAGSNAALTPEEQALLRTLIDNSSGLARRLSLRIGFASQVLSLRQVIGLLLLRLQSLTTTTTTTPTTTTTSTTASTTTPQVIILRPGFLTAINTKITTLLALKRTLIAAAISQQTRNIIIDLRLVANPLTVLQQQQLARLPSCIANVIALKKSLAANTRFARLTRSLATIANLLAARLQATTTAATTTTTTTTTTPPPPAAAAANAEEPPVEAAAANAEEPPAEAPAANAEEPPAEAPAAPEQAEVTEAPVAPEAAQDPPAPEDPANQG